MIRRMSFIAATSDMRIVLLLNARFPTEKAYGVQTVTMARGYAALGHEVAIAYPRRSAEVPASIDGVRFLPFGWRIGLRFSWMFHPLRLLGVFSAIPSLRAFRPDLVIVNDPLQAALLSKKFPVVWEVHDVPDTHRFTRRVILRKILRDARAIISTNQLKLEALAKLAKLPSHLVVANAVTFDPAVYRSIDREEARRVLGLSADEFSVVYTGQLFDWKGVDTLVASAAYLPRRCVVHIVGGTGADFDRCTHLAAALPSSAARVVFHGQRPTGEVPRWLRAASVVVIPNSGKFEVSLRDTSPLKLFEALAAGAAIIASDLPSIQEAVGNAETVQFVQPDDATALAQAIEALADDPTRTEALRRRAGSVAVLTGRERAERIVAFVSQLPAPAA